MLKYDFYPIYKNFSSKKYIRADPQTPHGIRSANCGTHFVDINENKHTF